MQAQRFSLAMIAPLATLATGCGMTGKWSSVQLEPEIARNEFRMFAADGISHDFTKANLVLAEEGTYSGEAFYGDHVHRSSGTWEKKGDVLTLVDSGGAASSFDADLDAGGNKLKLTRRIEGTDVVLTLERQ